MFFGLINSPTIFQMMMNEMSYMKVAQGWLSVYMDDITIHTKPHSDKNKEQYKLQHKQLVQT
jgi:hypothetical protein